MNIPIVILGILLVSIIILLAVNYKKLGKESMYPAPDPQPIAGTCVEYECPREVQHAECDMFKAKISKACCSVIGTQTQAEFADCLMQFKPQWDNSDCKLCPWPPFEWVNY